ncbi:MAG TPA: class II fructose-bisphosphate aldolase [Anaerolineae bacterium]|nr:class II fructose-bisphosphate aldolase [Anaerolineae bacterium]
MKAMDALLQSLQNSVAPSDGRAAVADEARLKTRLDGLVYEAVFGDGETKAAARWLIWEIAQALGIRPASIHELYMARGQGAIERSFTVPAMNLRMLAYDSARAVFRAARAIDAGAIIFEIARSEIGYTDQRPAEYASAVLAAAVKEGHRGPLFIQGDHFQINAKKFAETPDAEMQAVCDLSSEAVAAGFYNIDIDTSTLVDLSQPTTYEQQRANFERCAEVSRFVRERQPAGVTISLGGEIGEVGGKNSNEEELRAFMDGYNAALGSMTGISKISIQTGTSHGGVVLPDGTLADVAIDFDVLRRLSDAARVEYHLGGAVQHGASTLPESAFGKFVESGAVEVHLATAFQTLIMDHETIPRQLRDEIRDWLYHNAMNERKAKDTDEQFIYKTRKKAIGPFKRDFWNLSAEARAAIGQALERRFAFLFEQLGVRDTARTVAEHVHPVEIHQPMPTGAVEAVKAESVEGLAD